MTPAAVWRTASSRSGTDTYASQHGQRRTVPRLRRGFRRGCPVIVRDEFTNQARKVPLPQRQDPIEHSSFIDRTSVLPEH
jgi:hypothetical protein